MLATLLGAGCRHLAIRLTTLRSGRRVTLSPTQVAVRPGVEPGCSSIDARLVDWHRHAVLSCQEQSESSRWWHTV